MPREKYGIQWKDNVSDLHIELWCFRMGGSNGMSAKSTEETAKEFHFKNIVKMLWGPKSKREFVWNPWNEKMLAMACQHKRLGLCGSGSCVRGDTRIENPLTGESSTIQELYEKGIAPVVMTLAGPAQATVPFVKGFEELYEVVLSNGRKFVCTASHRVLKNHTFVEVSCLSPGDFLLSYEPVHLESNSEPGPSVHGEGARCSRKKAVNFQERYSAYCRPYDEQLPLEASIAQSFFPSQDDAPEHNLCAFSGMDGFYNKHTHIRPYQSFRPSKHNVLAPQPLLENLLLPQISLKIALPLCHSFQPPCQSQTNYNPHYTFLEQAPCFYRKHYLGLPFQPSEFSHRSDAECIEHFLEEHPIKKQQPECFYAHEKVQQSGAYRISDTCDLGFSCVDYTVSQSKVVSIRKSGKHLFYDLQVPNIHHYFAEGAIHHNSGKTTFMAVWGLVNWLCAPQETLVLFTSTSLEDSRRRIWGDVESFFMAACDKDGKPFLPGKLTSSIGKIRTAEGGVKYSDKCGLQLIPGDRAKEKENIGKLIGAKNKRVFLLGDEFPELSPALTEAAEGNLMLNPFFQMIVSGNFKGLYDPYGLFVEPVDGWASITPEFEQWEIKGGICLRFDGLKSPNVIEGFEKYKGIYTTEHLEKHKLLGENSATFWRMCRSYPCQNADVDRIWSDADLLKGDCHSTKVVWKDEPVDVASLDPAFVNGGDDAVQTFGKLGTSIENKNVLLVTEQSVIPDDVRNKTDNRSVQVAKKFRDNCIKRGIKPENAAYDISGGGVVFGGLLGEVWSPKLLGVQFGGAASERPASAKDKRPAKEAFTNRVAELWFAGVDFAQSGQLKGLGSKCCTELTERRVKERIKSATGMKVQIESKKEMKSRTSGKSPDYGDSAIILLELCRERLNFRAVGMENTRAEFPRQRQDRKRLINRLYEGVTHEYAYAEA